MAALSKEDTLNRLAEARNLISDSDISPVYEVVIDFLDTAEAYVRGGVRWGLIEDTAMAFANAIMEETTDV